jgi:hypothetical protein
MSLIKNLKRREVEIFGAKRVVRNDFNRDVKKANNDLIKQDKETKQIDKETEKQVKKTTKKKNTKK